LDVIVYAAWTIPMVMMADVVRRVGRAVRHERHRALLVLALPAFLADDAVFAYAPNGVDRRTRPGAAFASGAALTKKSGRCGSASRRSLHAFLLEPAGTEAAAGDTRSSPGGLTGGVAARLLDRSACRHRRAGAPISWRRCSTRVPASTDRVNGPGQPLALPFEMSDIAATSGSAPTVSEHERGASDGVKAEVVVGVSPCSKVPSGATTAPSCAPA
jgi:hypothetical protein